MTSHIARFLTLRSLPVLLAIVAIALVLPSVWTGWQQDDLVQRYTILGNPDPLGKVISPLDLFHFLDGDSTYAHSVMDLGVIPWWTLPTVRLSFWRPLSSLTHWLDILLWRDNSILMHVQSLLWFGALVIVATFLYRRVQGPTWVAGLAALFFALDDAHGLPAGWLANRNAIVAGLFGVLAILVHDRWRRDNWKPGVVAGPLLLLLGLLSGESALAACGYLFSYALFIDGGSRRARVVSMVPYASVAVLWLVTYGALGYGTSGSGFYVDPLSEPLRFLWAVVWKGPLLLVDQLALPPSSIVLFVPDQVVTGLWIWAVLLLALLSGFLYPLLRRDRTARFWFTGMVLSIPLVCSTMPHSRLLLFAGIGGFGLLSQWIGGILNRDAWIPAGRMWRVAARTMLFVFLVVHLIFAPVFLPLNATSAAFAQKYIQDPALKVSVGPEFADQDLVILNHPIVFYGQYFMTARFLAGQSIPRRLRVIAPALVPLRVTRLDARTLVVEPNGGFCGLPFDNVFRGRDYPMKEREQVLLTGMTVEILRVTSDGRPAKAAFHFAVPLEHRSLRWLRWDNGSYATFQLPAIGEEIEVPAAPPLF